MIIHEEGRPELPSTAGFRDHKLLDELIKLSSELELFHSTGDEAYATASLATGAETFPIESTQFDRWIAVEAEKRYGLYPREQVVKELKRQLSARAKHSSPEHEVHLRVAGDKSTIVVDLANELRQVIEVTGENWRVATPCCDRFFRPLAMRSLPLPKPLHEANYFYEFFNCEPENDLRLLLAWLVFSLNPLGPYPILILQGEAGSAKTSLAIMLRLLIDPVSVPLRSLPRDERDFVIAARTNRVLCFDNLSGLKDRDADILCRMATGAGFATRQLYSNLDEITFKMRRPVILNGIDELATRQDLIDRALVLWLPKIPPNQRREEATVTANFERIRPYLFGYLLSALSAAMARLPTVVLDETPRMADFARWSTAAEEALGWEPGGFLRAYRDNQCAALDIGVETSAVARSIKSLLSTTGTWDGTPAELLDRLNGIGGENARKARDWPIDSARLGGHLRRLAPALRAQGMHVEFTRDPGNQRSRRIRISTLRDAAASIVYSKTTVPTVPTDDTATLAAKLADAIHKPANRRTSTEVDRDSRDGALSARERIRWARRPFLALYRWLR